MKEISTNKDDWEAVRYMYERICYACLRGSLTDSQASAFQQFSEAAQKLFDAYDAFVKEYWTKDVI